MNPWKYITQEFPSDDQDCIVKLPWTCTAWAATYRETTQDFADSEGHLLPWYLCWRWKPAT